MPMKLQATWRMEPGDGTGCSIADMQVRNARGECGSQGCVNPLDHHLQSRFYLQSRFCPTCTNKMLEALNRDPLEKESHASMRGL